MIIAIGLIAGTVAGFSIFLLTEQFKQEFKWYSAWTIRTIQALVFVMFTFVFGPGLSYLFAQSYMGSIAGLLLYLALTATPTVVMLFYLLKQFPMFKTRILWHMIAVIFAFIILIPVLHYAVSY